MVSTPEWTRRLPTAAPRRGAIPLSDIAALRSQLVRTTVTRLALAGVLVVLVFAAVWRASRLDPQPLPFLDRRTTTIVVLDQSKSVYVGAYRRISSLLRVLATADAPVGVVAFSDTAYEMMPPGTPGSELAPLLRFYTKARPGETNVDPDTRFPSSPWADVFSGGTKISAGIDLARRIVGRDGVRSATIVLASDLETASADEASLAESLLQASRDPRVRLKVLPLFPIADDLEFFRKFLPASAFIKPIQLRPRALAARHTRLLASSPWPLAVVAALLLVALAANELLCARVVTVHTPEVSA